MKVCYDCPSCSISHETNGEYAYQCTAVTTGNGGTTHPIVGHDDDIKQARPCLLDEEEEEK